MMPEDDENRLLGSVAPQKVESTRIARRGEKELRDLIETIPAMVWSALPDASCVFVNRSWQEYTGLSAEDSAGSGWQAAVHPEDLKEYMDRVRASFAAGDPFEDELRLRRAADGKYRWFLARGVPLRDEQGNILKWCGTLTDIEDRKQAEALLAGEKRILEMVAKGDSLAQILDSLCRLVEEQARGVTASILLLEGNRLRHGGAPSLPKAYMEAIDGTAIGPFAGSCGTAAHRGQPVIVSDIATDPLWAEHRDFALPHSLRACWSTPIFSSEGKVIATFAMYYREPHSPSLRDQQIVEQITDLAGVAIERKLTQEKLRRSEAYLAEAQRLSRTGSWAYNPTTKKTLYWSEEMFRIWAFDPQHGPPDRELVVRRIHPEDLERMREKIRKAVSGRVKVDVDECRILLPDGTLKYVSTTLHPVFEDTGNVVEYVGTAADVTERRRAEQERERLRQVEADLAHISRVSMMGELAASLAHEIKQPITAAVTNAKTCLRWLEREPADLEEARESALRLVNNVARAADIINRMRSLYTKGMPHRELVDVNELIEEMIVLLRNEASRYSIPIRSDLAKNLPMLVADRVQLQQVLLNLMLNGIEAMKDGSGVLTVKSERAQDAQLLISISDTGVGLPSEKADQIFDAFFTTKPQGTGMGLTISRSIVEAHGGRLWATSNSGGGATFHFTLPSDAHARQ